MVRGPVLAAMPIARDELKGKLDDGHPGAEWVALRGMAATLERSAGVKLLTEFWPRGLALAGVGAAEFLRWLEDHGFRLWDVDDWSSIRSRSSGGLTSRPSAICSASLSRRPRRLRRCAPRHPLERPEEALSPEQRRRLEPPGLFSASRSG